MFMIILPNVNVCDCGMCYRELLLGGLNYAEDETGRHDGGGVLGCSHHISVGYTHIPLPLAFEA